MSDTLKLVKDQFSSEAELKKAIDKACDLMEEIYDSGKYPQMIVERIWSKHNPVIDGELAQPKAYRWYLKREIERLVTNGATVFVKPSREALPMNNPDLFDNLDESDWDITQKKLFLFRAERIDISLDRLRHYTGTKPADFQRYILFTNYDMHVEVFLDKFPDCVKPEREGVQMPAYHHKMDNNSGLTLINIGVGPSNAKTITDHVGVLRPDAMVMVGHCGGLRNHQDIGDFVLANGYYRADRVLDDLFPIGIPISPNYILNRYLKEVLDQHDMNHRIGTVYTTANRNWEFSKAKTVEEIHMSRSVAIDMESSTVATNGFRYRIPHATLLCVSDKPLHGKPKLTDAAQSFYQNSKEMHLEMVIDALQMVKDSYPEGLPNSSIRAFNEPLMGGSG
ncbi:MAG: AMP nucleosidase [Gracilimonas sp.]|uniref:AMP nucleosidase n=1 Tax=Gracilimonas sediminicola TaxID=2952158 RepID=A0A9X2L2G6_9BACT|nr:MULTISPECIES: AMP nucleosidase [Gracilimonas]MBO6584659.1 AMP nucleosidase [Gracilimonas sp.]MBO6616070.1 AMP nucleosidase [Gracilimonas sp.]MCP9291106.1 AMP nucleosidase [Gracilimonas sediminicola]